MRLRHPNLSAVVSWTIALALTLSPVMAQTTQDAASVSVAPQNEESADIAKGQQSPIVDNPVLPELPKAKTATAFPTMARSSTFPTVILRRANPPRSRGRSIRPGKASGSFWRHSSSQARS